MQVVFIYYFCEMNTSKKRSDCPINFALEIFGDRWTLLIIRDLMFKGKHFYGEFLLSEENIATNILADRLMMLEAKGIISKSKDPGHKQKINYRLTRKGIDLLPVLVEIILWSSRYDKHSAVDRAFVKAVTRDRNSVIGKISKELRNALDNPDE